MLTQFSYCRAISSFLTEQITSGKEKSQVCPKDSVTGVLSKRRGEPNMLVSVSVSSRAVLTLEVNPYPQWA